VHGIVSGGTQDLVYGRERVQGEFKKKVIVRGGVK